MNETNKKHEDIKPEYLFKEELLSLNKNYNDKELNKFIINYLQILKNYM